MMRLLVHMRLFTRMFITSIAALSAIPIVVFGCATEELPPYGDPAKVVGGTGTETSSSTGGSCTPNPSCAVSFANDLFPLFQGTTKCAETSTCHGGGFGDLTLMDTDAKTLRAGLLAATLAGDPYIVPCDENASKILCNMDLGTGVTNTYGKCAPLMPKLSVDAVDDMPLTQVQVDSIKGWILCGAPDN